jgi:hypothetical protein
MQLQMSYDAGEDRILVGINLGERVAAFWLTRRVVALLWPILWERAQSGLGGSSMTEARPWLASLQHDQVREKQVLEQLPVFVQTAAPKLVTTLRHGKAAQGSHLLGLLDIQGEGEMLTLDDESLHGMIRLLEAAVAAANWNLDLRKPDVPLLAVGSERRH